MTAREELKKFAASLGHNTVVATVEADPAAVWLTEDDAPTGVAGYYKKIHITAPYRFLEDGRVAAFEFQRAQTWYRIQCGSASSADENLERVRGVLRTLVQWSDDGVARLDDLLTPFARNIASDEWWRILRVPPDASPDEIEDGYRRQAWKVHPDRGGTHEAFLRLQAAYTEARGRRPRS